LFIGYVLGNNAVDTTEDTAMTETDNSDSHSHADDSGSDHMDMHMHDMYEVGEGQAAPVLINMEVSKDNKSGWNLYFDIENFTFAPKNASGEHVDGEGHAHLYIDGTKITRLYSTSYYIGELTEGEHTVTVTLNTNDHKDYAVNGQTIQASKTIVDDHHSE
jgi:hypothetical protein